MAPKLLLILCVVGLWAVDLCHAHDAHAHAHAHAHAPAPAPSFDCSSLILTMSDCLPFVSNGSTVSKPEPTCCSSLKTVLKTAPSCLCQAFKTSSQFGVVLNVTRALALPAACKLSAPSAANCGLSEMPASAPGVSPLSSTSSPGLNAPASEQSPEKAPSPSPGNAASALIPFSAASLIVCLLVAVYSGL
ncbi:hypothetical protein VNO77_22266 [Canavalia gladiata]|uniref:Bifunctional inhibitor/plant lipid transfer protein/seed storage helical domain-containing protein n=1 Tax=Canavalia gladiata TaxID=3824 RepID=A0AAN9L2Q9_CANGL